MHRFLLFDTRNQISLCFASSDFVFARLASDFAGSVRFKTKDPICKTSFSSSSSSSLSCVPPIYELPHLPPFNSDINRFSFITFSFPSKFD